MLCGNTLEQSSSLQKFSERLHMKIDSGYIFVILLAPIFLPILIPLVLFLAFKKASYETRKMRRWAEDEA